MKGLERKREVVVWNVATPLRLPLDLSGKKTEVGLSAMASDYLAIMLHLDT